MTRLKQVSKGRIKGGSESKIDAPAGKIPLDNVRLADHLKSDRIVLAAERAVKDALRERPARLVCLLKHTPHAFHIVPCALGGGGEVVEEEALARARTKTSDDKVALGRVGPARKAKEDDENDVAGLKQREDGWQVGRRDQRILRLERSPTECRELSQQQRL